MATCTIYTSSVLFFMSALLAGCQTNDGSNSFMQQGSAGQLSIAGNYQIIANCAYERLDRSEGAGIKKTDLGSTVKLTMDTPSLRLWEVTIKPEGKDRTSVVLTDIKNIVGKSTIDTSRILPEIQRCEVSG